MPVRLASAAPRTLAWSAVSVPEGSSTSGASSGGATAGTVGQAITSTSSKAAARRRRISVRTLLGLHARRRGQQHPVLEQAAGDRAQLGVEVVELARADAAEALGVGDQDRRQRRRARGRRASISRTSPPVSARSASIASSQASRTAGATSSETRVADDADPQAGRLAGRQLLAEEDRAEQAAVGGVGAERAGDDRGRDRRHVVAVHRRAAEGRLQPGQAAVGGGEADRADPVGADRAGDEAGGDRGGRAARGAAGAALGVPGVAGRAVDGDVAGAAGAELVHVADADDRRRRRRAGPGRGRTRPGAVGGEHLGGAEALRAPGQRPLVLDHDRDAVQRSLRGRRRASRASAPERSRRPR